MTALILGLILIVLSGVALALQRLYSVVPARELKRLAAKKDYLAQALYRPVAYEGSFRLLLWIVFSLSFSFGTILFVRSVPWWVSGICLPIFTLSLMVGIMPLSLTRKSARFATLFSAALHWLVSRSHGFLDVFVRYIAHHRELEKHSQLYEKEDFLRLIGQQKGQPDSRIAAEELEIIERTLRFGAKQAADIVVPIRKSHIVNADEAIGPVLLDQLHAYGQSSFLVYKDDPGNIIGSLAMRDAITAKQGGRVFDLVRNDLAYVHEDFTLQAVLEAFQRTGQRIVTVINAKEEFLGSITLDGLLAELLGVTQGAVTPAYGNRGEIAAYQPSEPESQEIQPEESVKQGSEPNAQEAPAGSSE